MGEDEPIWTKSCRAFYQHWRSLMVEGEIPHSRDFLDHPDPALISSAFILEVQDNGSIIRFMGTALVELWGKDHTNLVFGADLPTEAAAIMNANAKSVVVQPCGMIEVTEFMTQTGRSFQMETIMLPLAVDANRPPRLCSYSQIYDDLDDVENAGPRYKTKRQHSWIDVGFGVPVDSPKMSE